MYLLRNFFYDVLIEKCVASAQQLYVQISYSAQGIY